MAGSCRRRSAAPSVLQLLTLLLLSSAGAEPSPSQSGPERGGPEPAKQLRWYIGNVARVEGFLLGNNSKRFLNTSANLGAPITGGIYQCCKGFVIQENGTIRGLAEALQRPRSGRTARWNASLFAAAGIDMYHTVSGSTTSHETPPVDAACAAAARKQEFARELLQLAEAWQLRGMHTDWESAVNNNLTCWIELWTEVSRLFRAHGKQLAMSIVRSPLAYRVRSCVFVAPCCLPSPSQSADSSRACGRTTSTRSRRSR